MYVFRALVNRSILYKNAWYILEGKEGDVQPYANAAVELLTRDTKKKVVSVIQIT